MQPCTNMLFLLALLLPNLELTKVGAKKLAISMHANYMCILSIYIYISSHLMNIPFLADLLKQVHI